MIGEVRLAAVVLGRPDSKARQGFRRRLSRAAAILSLIGATQPAQGHARRNVPEDVTTLERRGSRSLLPIGIHDVT